MIDPETEILIAILSERDMDEVEAMNFLQDEGMISDNCIHASDVAAVDAINASMKL